MRIYPREENIALIGLPGTGKTNMPSIALAVKAIEQGYTVLFTTLSEMMEDLHMSRADNSFRQKLKIYFTGATDHRRIRTEKAGTDKWGRPL